MNSQETIKTDSHETPSHEIMAGLVTAIVMIASTLSYSAAIFSGTLAGSLALGIGCGLVGACITAAFFALRSGIPFAIAGPDSKPTAVLTALAAGTAAAWSRSGHLESAPAAAMLALIVATILTGAVLYFSGRWNMGRWVRFVPFPVVGGFMAASGWLLIAGAIRILTRVELRWSSLGELLTATHLEQLAAGIIFAGAMTVAGRRKSIWGFPALLFGVAALAHLARAVAGFTVADAQNAGWLLDAPSRAVLPVAWLSEHWPGLHSSLLILLASQGGDYVALVLVTAFTMLLGITSIEVEAKLNDDIDVDHELRVNGLANLVAGIFGGMVGTLSLSRTVFNYQNGGRTRLSGFICAGACLATLAFGTSALAYIPVTILGGMLLRLGVDMLDDWLVRAWKRMGRLDYAQVVIILIAIVLWGFLAGVAVGVIAACVTFAVSTSRIRLVKQEMDRTSYASRVDRPMTETRELVRHGSAIRIIWLHGFLFFGSVNRLLQHVKQMVTELGTGCRMVILDFHEVLGIDSSAAMVLARMRQFAEREDFLMVLCGLPPMVEELMAAGGLLDPNPDPNKAACLKFPALDAALEWCEDRLLQERMSPEEAKRSADEWLAREIGGQEMFRQFASYLEMVSYPAGGALFAQGDTAEFLCLMYSGRVSVVFRTGEGHEVRLRSMRRHTMIGEMGLYRSAPRGATVLVDQPTVVYRLSREALEQMEADDPPLAYAFHKFVVRALAERLDFANREVSAFQR